MPIIRVEIAHGFDDGTKESLRSAVKAAVLRTLAPKEAKYDYVALREVFAKPGDGVPLVEVDLRPGREPKRKEALVKALAQALEENCGYAEEDLYVLFRENPAENHYCGGKPLPNWVPADK